MSNVKVTVEIKGLNEFRKSPEIVDLIQEKANRIRNQCGEGYATDLKYMPTRAIASVYTETPKAMMDNSKNNTLLKATEGVRE